MVSRAKPGGRPIRANGEGRLCGVAGVAPDGGDPMRSRRGRCRDGERGAASPFPVGGGEGYIGGIEVDVHGFESTEAGKGCGPVRGRWPCCSEVNSYTWRDDEVSSAGRAAPGRGDGNLACAGAVGDVCCNLRGGVDRDRGRSDAVEGHRGRREKCVPVIATGVPIFPEVGVKEVIVGATANAEVGMPRLAPSKRPATVTMNFIGFARMPGMLSAGNFLTSSKRRTRR